MAENTKENMNPNCDNDSLDCVEKMCAKLNIAEEACKERIEILTAAEKLRETLHCTFKLDDEMQLTVTLDETANWEAGVEYFSETIGPYVTNLIYKTPLDEYQGYHEQFKGVLKNFLKLSELDVNNLEDAILLELPSTVKQLRIKRFNCYLPPQKFEILQNWKENGLSLITHSASYLKPVDLQGSIVFPKLSASLREFLDQCTSKKLAIKEQNLFEFEEIDLDDIECFFSYFTSYHYLKFGKKFEELKNLKTIRLLPNPKGCFFVHRPLKLEHIEQIEIYTSSGQSSNVKTCFDCVKSLKKSCPNVEGVQLRGDFLLIPALVGIAPGTLLRLKLKYFERPLNLELNFPQLEELTVCGEKNFEKEKDDWFKDCVDWPQMNGLKILNIGPKMYIDKDIFHVLAQKCPNLEEFTVVENHFFTDDLKILAKQLWENANVIHKSKAVVF